MKMKNVISRHTEYYCDICRNKIKDLGFTTDFYKFKKFNLVNDFDKQGNYAPKKKFRTNMHMCKHCYDKFKYFVENGGHV